MKINKIFQILLAGAMVMPMVSCGDDFLERVPKSSYVEDNFYTSDEALQAATGPLYTRAWFDYNKRPAVQIGTARANDFLNPWFGPSFLYFQVTALNEELQSTWTAFYATITMANALIDGIETKCGPDVTENGKNIAIAEARLMRGIAYLYTTCLWDNIIIFEKNQDVIREPKQPLRPGYDGLTMAIRDLTWAAEHLPEKPLATGRATKWSAEAMLAKAYLFRSGWNGGSRDEADLEKSRQYALDVCKNSGLNLLPNYDDLFHIAGNNNEESLLAMQWVENGEWGVRNTLLADIAFSSKVTGGINVWGGGNASVDMLSLYEPRDSVRLYSTFFVYGHKYPEINRADGGYVHEEYSCPIRKFIPGSMEDNGGVYMESMSFPQNTYFVRLADTYLTLAEACLGNNGSVSAGDGLEYFNKVRERADMPKVDSYNFDDLIKERRIEFCMEYVNWYDMVSWYKWQPEKMLAYFKAQHRGEWADRYFRGEDGYMKFQYMDYDTDTYVDLDLTSTEPWPGPSAGVEVNIQPSTIFLPYPEADVIQNPLLKEDPIAYPFEN